MGFQCGTCDRWFNSLHGRQQHMNALGHYSNEYECEGCGRCFGSQAAMEQHMNALGHWSGGQDYDCRCCGVFFYNEDDRDEHEIEECFYCAGCDREFTTENSIRQHLNSRIHQGTDIRCPFCKRLYATATGLCHHLEAGACPRAPTLDRDQVYRLVRSKDPGGVISKNLIGWYGSPTYEADELTWNGDGYQCYLCCRVFPQLNSLNQHLGSPIHQQDLYHCPNRIQCGKEFKSLAAVMNHLESESCGFTRFENVQRAFPAVVNSKKLISFR